MAPGDPPGACYKCCCPVCAVAGHEGCGVPAAMACCLGCWFTMICWTPKGTENEKGHGAAPAQLQMESLAVDQADQTVGRKEGQP